MCHAWRSTSCRSHTELQHAHLRTCTCAAHATQILTPRLNLNSHLLPCHCGVTFPAGAAAAAARPLDDATSGRQLLTKIKPSRTPWGLPTACPSGITFGGYKAFMMPQHRLIAGNIQVLPVAYLWAIAACTMHAAAALCSSALGMCSCVLQEMC
jgi:hypothetical protein